MPTIKDIAQLAGVSQGTVSNVLNGKGIVSSSKIKLVQNAAAALGYTVNERAKILRKGKARSWP
jgi:multiple sugar transport system substrate-binding protein